jgi:uncharacterized membrane protein
VDLDHLVSVAGTAMEIVGVAVIVGGSIAAMVRALVHIRVGGNKVAFRTLRIALARSLLLGLEFLVGADIIRTVSSEPTLMDALVLGLIVLIRTFLSFTMALELEGRWPWRVAEGDLDAVRATSPALDLRPVSPS